MMNTITVDGITLYEVSHRTLNDKEAVYIVFPNNAMPSQWGIVDKDRRITIHKDLTVRFTDRCKYYVLSSDERLNIPEQDKIIQLRY